MEAAARDVESLRGLKSFKGFQGLTAGLNALTPEGHAQANGRLQRWNSKGLRPQGLVEAAARRPRHGRPRTAKAYGQRAWWKLPRRIWMVLGVLKVLKV